MATTIKIKHSNIGTNAPSNLESGELAVNTVDKKMWIGNGSTEVALIGPRLSGIEALASVPDGGFLVGDSNGEFVVESEGTARTSLGLGSLSTKNSVDLSSSEATNTLPVGKGGTGGTSFDAGKILKGAGGSSALVASGITIDSNDVLTFGGDGFIIPKASSNPLSPTAGQLFSDSSSSRLKYQAGATARELAYVSEIPNSFTIISGDTGDDPEADSKSDTLNISGGTHITTTGSATADRITISTDATNVNTFSTIVARDGSGNFSAGTITANLTGNASTATTLATSRNFSITGDITAAAVGFNGSGAVELNATIDAGVVGATELATNAVTTAKIANDAVTSDKIADGAVTLGTQTSGDYVSSISPASSNEITVTNVGNAYTVGLPDNVTITSDLTVGGDLIINGTTTTVNSTTVTLDDPIITLGGDTAPGNDDSKDRGVEFRYYDTQARLGFMGYDNSAGNFILLTDATNTSEAFTGTKGTLVADLTGDVTGDLTGNADTATTLATGRNFSITGDITASAVSFNGSGAVELNATIDAGVVGATELATNAVTTIKIADDAVTNAKIADNAVTLGTQTTGNYVASVSAGTGISVSGTGEGATVTITNDAPDQTVALTGSGSVSISGTYPNFTITGTDTTYSAGTGLTLSGTQFSINSTYSGQTSITTLGTVTTGTIDGGTF